MARSAPRGGLLLTIARSSIAERQGKDGATAVASAKCCPRNVRLHRLAGEPRRPVGREDPAGAQTPHDWMGSAENP